MAATLMNASGLNRTRSATVFLVNETVAGKMPSLPTTADAFGLTTTPVIGQSGNYTDTSEIGAELISTDRVLNYMEYSTFDFEYYAKPAGAYINKNQYNSGSPITFTQVNAASSTTVTVTLANTAGLQVGDTITVTGSVDADGGSAVAGADGTYMITTVTANTSFTYEVANAVTITAVTTGPVFQPKKYDFSKTPEHDLLVRTFGGVKYMSGGKIGAASAYQGGEQLSYSSANYTIAEGAATVAQYYLKNTIQTFTVSSRQFTDTSVQMYTAVGSLPTNFSVSLAKDGPVTFSSSFQSNKVYYAGTATVATTGTNALAQTVISSSGGTATLDVTHPIRWYGQDAVALDVAWYQASPAIGTPVKFVVDGVTFPSADADFLKITAISGKTVTVTNDTANSVTLPAEATSENAFMVPYLPAPCPDTGSILDQRKVQVFLTGAPSASEDTNELLDFDPQSSETQKLFHANNAINVTAFSIDFDRSITTPALTEMTGDEYPPASYIINEPTITGSMTLLLRPKDFQYMNSLRENPKRCIGVRIGETVGRIIEMGIYTAFMEIPTPADADGATQIDIPFTAVRGVECSDVDKFFIRYR